MITKKTVNLLLLVSSLIFLSALNSSGQNIDQKEADGRKVLITVFLKPNQAKTRDEILKHLDKTGFWDEFPPRDAEVVSWYVLMGIGQVVTLKIPAEKLRELNLAVEKNAWGAFYTEFYPTYDFVPIWKEMKKENEEK